MYTESGTGKTENKHKSPHNVELPGVLKDPILRESTGKLAELRRDASSSLIGGEKVDEDIQNALDGLSREEQVALLRSFAESQQQIEKDLTEAQKMRIEQVEIFSTLLLCLQNALDGKNDAAFSSMNLWFSKIFQGADVENLEQFLKSFDPIDVSTYLIQNKDKTLYDYMSEKYPGQIDMLKRVTYHSAIPFDGTVWGQQNGAIMADVQNKSELLKYRTEVMRFFRSDDSLGHYEMARSLAIEGLHDKFEALKGKVDEKKIQEETDQKMKKEFGEEWEEATLAALKASPENKGKTDEELRATINMYRQGMEQETLKHVRERTIGQMIFDADDFSKYSPEEKALWDEYKDSMGFGVFDVEDETWDSITKNLAEFAAIAISGGIANGIVKGLSIGARAILPKLIAHIGGRLSTNISRYIIGKIALKTVGYGISMVTDATSFEMVFHALTEGDLNMYNEPGWQSKILWSSLTFGAFKGVGKLQQTAMLKSFAEKIATGAGDIAHLKGLNTVLKGFPVGLQAGFGKIIAGMSAFEASRQLEASVMFLTGAAQATLSGQDLDNFYANLYDYCITNGGENYFHAMVSAHALNLAHNGTSALGKKIKDRLGLKKSSDKPGAPDKGPDKNNPEIQQILSGELLPAIQKEIRESGDATAQNVKRLEIAERMIQKLRGNDIKLTDAERKIIEDVHNMPATGPDGTYSPEDIAARAIKLAEIFTGPVGTMGHAIREALIRNGICGSADAMADPTTLDRKGKIGIPLDGVPDRVTIAGLDCGIKYNVSKGRLEIFLWKDPKTALPVNRGETFISNSDLRLLSKDFPPDVTLEFDWKPDGKSVTVKKVKGENGDKKNTDDADRNTLDREGSVGIEFADGLQETNIAGRPFEFEYDRSSGNFKIFAKGTEKGALISNKKTSLSNDTLRSLDPQFPQGISLTFEWKDGHIVIRKVSGERAPQKKSKPEQEPIKRNTTPKRVEEVPRSVTIDIMGDTHGSYEGYLANLKSLGVLDNAGNFTGSKTRIVLVGDILGDRNTGSMDTYRHIDWLRKQGADVHVLAGNHEDFVIGYLTNGNHGGADALAQSLDGQGAGLLEFGRFADPSLKKIDVRTFPPKEQILAAMRRSPEGRQILEGMCQMKIGEHIDDTLFVHTDPTKAMIDMIQQYGIDKINTIFQANMRASLLDGKDIKTEPSFELIRDTFLHTENGRSRDIPPITAAQGKSLKAAGINRIIHGHTNHHGEYSDVGGVTVHSVDNSAFKKGEDDGRRSVGRLDTNGGLTTSGD